MTGTRQTVESAWLCAAESVVPISFERMAQTPHERSAARDQMSQRGMFKRLPIPNAKPLRNPKLQFPNRTACHNCSPRMVAADVRRRISVRKTNPPHYLGGYGSSGDSCTHPWHDSMRVGTNSQMPRI